MRPAWFPERELRFACRSGFLTKTLWVRHFGNGFERSWNSRRWQRLISEGWFQHHPYSHFADVIVPNRLNSDVVRLPEGGVARPPFVAQLKHDESLYDGLLTLERDGLVAEYLTEAETKRSAMILGNQSMATLKLPDLVLTLRGGQVLGIELELTQKSRRRYQAIFRAYRERKDVQAILFVTPNRAVLNAIVQSAAHAMFPTEKVPLAFMTIENWRKDASNLKIGFQKSSTSLKEFSGFKAHNLSTTGA